VYNVVILILSLILRDIGYNTLVENVIIGEMELWL